MNGIVINVHTPREVAHNQLLSNMDGASCRCNKEKHFKSFFRVQKHYHV